MSTPVSINCIRKVAQIESAHLPCRYAYYTHPTDTAASEPHQYSIPIIDMSLLASNHPHLKSKAIRDLHRACQDWGFFMVVNHGIPEELMRGIVEATGEFFELREEEKPEFQPKNVLDPIRYGTSFNTAIEKVFCWRDFLKIFVHPHYHCPDKPQSLRDLLPEYCEKIRDVAGKLLEGISESLGIDYRQMKNALKLSESFQIFIANLYPPCPNPDVALGIPPHSDHGLLTLLLQNQVCGLQIQHDDKWINVDPIPNSILVNTCDQLEIFSNGKYKSVLHRAVVNSEKTRISIAVANGPALDAVVGPGVEEEGKGAEYVAMKYKDYIYLQQSNPLSWKSCMEHVRNGDE